jgi:two-component system sensor histidine kinase MtrB
LRLEDGSPVRMIRLVGWSPVRMFRRSLRARVVVTTLVLSAVVVLVLGMLLLRQVGHGLLDDKERAASATADAGLAEAQAQLSQTADHDAASIDLLLEQVTTQLAGRGGPAGIYEVAVLPSERGRDGYTSPPALQDGEIPSRLREQVRTGVEAMTFTTLHRGGHAVRALVIGAPLTAPTGLYELYHVFPLTSEQQTLSLVQRTLEYGGLVLLALLAVIAWLITRQVVTPVRVAARVAERLAAGQLQERIDVRGEDDMARLAGSFNRMADSLQQKIGQLEELSRVQRRFTADVSHELRTPLATVRMAADVLHDARMDFPAPTARSAELLHHELDRFEALLVDLLEISRYDAQAAVLDAEPLDLAALVRATAADAAGHAQLFGSEIDLSGVPDQAVVVEADTRRVHRVLRNLVENAIEHGEGRPVEISLRADSDAVAVVVRDHGCGLRPQDTERVFLRFWRADPARTRTSGGTGLGLSIAREDALLHNGWLHAWGRPGQGAAFRLVLPRRGGEHVRSSPLPLVPETQPLAGSR